MCLTFTKDRPGPIEELVPDEQPRIPDRLRLRSKKP
jgi:hypothetical protein